MTASLDFSLTFLSKQVSILGQVFHHLKTLSADIGTKFQIVQKVVPEMRKTVFYIRIDHLD